jgi:DNA-binding transcriptional regulator/RsmH inhibitor MraZ
MGLRSGERLTAALDAATGHVLLLPPAAAEAFEREIQSKEALGLTIEQRARVRTYWQWADEVEVTADGTIQFERVLADAARLGRQVRVVGHRTHLTVEPIDGGEDRS